MERAASVVGRRPRCRAAVGIAGQPPPNGPTPPPPSSLAATCAPPHPTIAYPLPAPVVGGRPQEVRRVGRSATAGIICIDAPSSSMKCGGAVCRAQGGGSSLACTCVYTH